MFKITSRLRAGEGEGWGEGVGEECVVDLRPTLVHQLVVARGHLTMVVVALGEGGGLAQWGKYLASENILFIITLSWYFENDGDSPKS